LLHLTVFAKGSVQRVEGKINIAILTFRESERKKTAAAVALATEQQRIQEELNARAADRAIAAGIPEEPPEMVEIEQPKAVTPVVATYGTRKLKEEEKWFLDEITDYDAVYKHFKNNPVLQQTLRTIATAAVKLGQTVPGTKTHHGLV